MVNRKALIVGLLIAGPVCAGPLPGEADMALAMRAIGTAAAQLDNAQQAFGQSLEALKQQAAKSAYWEDACRSTPECGGKAP